jgi:hypothetical protein
MKHLQGKAVIVTSAPLQRYSNLTPHAHSESSAGSTSIHGLQGMQHLIYDWLPATSSPPLVYPKSGNHTRFDIVQP